MYIYVGRSGQVATSLSASCLLRLGITSLLRVDCQDFYHGHKLDGSCFNTYQVTSSQMPLDEANRLNELDDKTCVEPSSEGCKCESLSLFISLEFDFLYGP